VRTRAQKAYRLPAASRGEAPSRTSMQAARAIVTFRIASPRPVELAAASWSSA